MTSPLIDKSSNRDVITYHPIKQIYQIISSSQQIIIKKPAIKQHQELLKVSPKSKWDQYIQHLVSRIENDVQQCALAHKEFDDFTEFGLTTNKTTLE